MEITDAMRVRIEQTDAQETLDEQALKEQAKQQLKEFYETRTKHLDSQPKFEAFAPVLECQSNLVTMEDTLKYIDTSGDVDERRERMRQVFQVQRIQQEHALIADDLLN